jgi:acylphosphatase
MRGFSKSVLVVDADLTFGRFIAHAFQPYGAKVRVFADPTSARPHVTHADLLILDLSLPLAAGFVLLDEISNADPDRLGHMLLVTSWPAGDVRSLVGDVPLIEKPVDIVELFDLVGLLATYPIKRELGAAWRTALAPSIVVGTKERMIAARRDYATELRRKMSGKPGRVHTLQDRPPLEGVKEMRDLIIHGIVQHVGYRFFATRVARRFGLNGWIQNMQDGTVTACVEGYRHVIDEWVEELKEGPRYSRVTRIDEVVREFVGTLPDFDIRF